MPRPIQPRIEDAARQRPRQRQLRVHLDHARAGERIDLDRQTLAGEVVEDREIAKPPLVD